MESSGRFEKIFFKMIREQNIAGADGAFGDGPSMHDINKYADNDSRIVKPLFTGKVQTRKGSTGGKKKKKKKETDGLDGVFLTGEEDEEAKGLDTSWEDGDIKVTIKEVLKYLDDNKVTVEEVSTDKLKPILIAGPRDPKRVQAADLKYPAVVVVDMKGKYKSILDGNHRVEKAINNDIPTIKVRKLDLRTAPEEYKALFNYEIEKEHG